MINHVESHLSKELRLTIACRYKVCEATKVVLETISKFKLYIKEEYGITLRNL
jgi:hypothetical protein